MGRMTMVPERPVETSAEVEEAISCGRVIVSLGTTKVAWT